MDEDGLGEEGSPLTVDAHDPEVEKGAGSSRECTSVHGFCGDGFHGAVPGSVQDDHGAGAACTRIEYAEEVLGLRDGGCVPVLEFIVLDEDGFGEQRSPLTVDAHDPEVEEGAGSGGERSCVDGLCSDGLHSAVPGSVEDDHGTGVALPGIEHAEEVLGLRDGG